MEIINRINIRDSFIITPLNDEYETVTLHGKKSKDGTGDLVIHRNKDNPDTFDMKIIISPILHDELNQVSIMQTFLRMLASELVFHKSIHHTLSDKPISMFVKPYIYAMVTAQDMETLYMFYNVITATIRMMSDNIDHQYISGILH